MRRLIVMTAVCSLGAGLAACGLPSDDNFTRIDEADDGFGLSLQSTTTTTTTTTTTLVPDATVDATTSTVLDTTTTGIPVEQVDIYFPIGRQLQKVPVDLSPDPSLSQVMAAILRGPLEGAPFVGLRAILPAKADVTANEDAGVAVVDFPVEIFDEIPSAVDQQLVFAQIVLTLTGRPGIGQVRFTQGGQPMQVYMGDASLSDPNMPVSRKDYKDFLAGSGEPIEPTTTTTTLAIDPADTLPPEG